MRIKSTLKKLSKHSFSANIIGLIGLLVSSILYVCISYADIIHTWEGIMYVTDSTVTFTWSPSEGASYYKVEAVWIDPKNTPVIFDLGTTTETRMVIQRPRVGHFYLRVKACDNEGRCSSWSESIDPKKTHDGKPFRVYFKTPPVSNVIIE